MSAPNTTIYVSGTLQSPGNSFLSYAPPALVNTNQVAASQILTLTSTPTLVTLPSGTAFFGVVPQSMQNTADISLKFHSGDSGFAINAVYGAPVIGVPTTSTTTFYLWSTVGTTVVVYSG